MILAHERIKWVSIGRRPTIKQIMTTHRALDGGQKWISNIFDIARIKKKNKKRELA